MGSPAPSSPTSYRAYTENEDWANFWSWGRRQRRMDCRLHTHSSSSFSKLRSTDGGLPQDFWQEHRPWIWTSAAVGPQTQTRSLVAAWTMDINTDPGCSRTLDPDITLGGSKVHDINMASVRGTDSEHPFGCWSSSQPGVAAWTTDTNVASCGITDHGGLSRRSNLESEPYHISGLRCCSEPGQSCWQRVQSA